MVLIMFCHLNGKCRNIVCMMHLSQEKAKIQKDLSILTDRLSKINEALARKVQARNEYDKTIQETEAAYMKILESSQTLLHVLKVRTRPCLIPLCFF